MQEPQRARQPEPERTRDVSAPKQRKEQVQRSSEPQHLSLYAQIVSNRVPPHLRLSASPQMPDEQPEPHQVEKEPDEQEMVPQGELPAQVAGEERSPVQRREALRAQLLRNQGVPPHLRLSSTPAAGCAQPGQCQVEPQERLQEPSPSVSPAQRREALRAQLWGTGVPPHLRLSPHSEPVQRKEENRTGLPDTLKEGVENLSGLSLDDVHVQYHSSKPAEVQALAYTQGTYIYVGPRQEQYLPHEAWHVVQQKQGRVRPSSSLDGVAINNSSFLEREADTQSKILAQNAHASQRTAPTSLFSSVAETPVVQRVSIWSLLISRPSIFIGKLLWKYGKDYLTQLLEYVKDDIGNLSDDVLEQVLEKVSNTLRPDRDPLVGGASADFSPQSPITVDLIEARSQGMFYGGLQQRREQEALDAAASAERKTLESFRASLTGKSFEELNALQRKLSNSRSEENTKKLNVLEEERILHVAASTGNPGMYKQSIDEKGESLSQRIATSKDMDETQTLKELQRHYQKQSGVIFEYRYRVARLTVLIKSVQSQQPLAEEDLEGLQTYMQEQMKKVHEDDRGHLEELTRILEEKKQLQAMLSNVLKYGNIENILQTRKQIEETITSVTETLQEIAPSILNTLTAFFKSFVDRSYQDTYIQTIAKGEELLKEAQEQLKEVNTRIDLYSNPQHKDEIETRKRVYDFHQGLKNY